MRENFSLTMWQKHLVITGLFKVRTLKAQIGGTREQVLTIYIESDGDSA